jgi:aryl-alcohol dehydrogenase-like predicted oxidoreductase
VERLDLLYAHVEDPQTSLAATVAAFGALVRTGEVGLLGVSNHRAWRVERARALASSTGVSGFEVVQYHRSYSSTAPTCPAHGPGSATRESVDQLEESLEAVDLELSADQRARLDAAH